MKRKLLALVMGLSAASAWADPITVVATLAPLIGGTAAAVVASYGLYVVGAAAAVYQSSRARRKARRAAADARAARIASLSDRSTTVLSATPPWQIVYGRCTVPGTVLAVFHSDKTGTREDSTTYTRPDGFIHYVVEWAHHECQAINEVFVDGVAVGPVDSSGNAISGDFFVTKQDSRRAVIPGAGFIDVPDPVIEILNSFVPNASGDTTDTVPTLSNGNTRINGVPGSIVNYLVQANSAAVRIAGEAVAPGQPGSAGHLGSTAQTVDTLLNSIMPTVWTTSHRLRGVTYSVITLDQEDRRFQGGNIPMFTADIKGRKVYDPRTGTTAWSDNPALCIRDWLTAEWGYGVTSDDIDDTYTIAAANACDVQISIDDGNGPYTAARFTCNGPITTDQAKEAVLTDLEESMAGAVVYGAQWMIQAGAWTAPVTLPGGGGLTDDDLDGQISLVQADTPMDELFNGVRGTYVPATILAGTGTGYLVNGAHSAGATTIALNSGTGTILAGNGLRIPGDDNTYVVTTGITAPGSVVIQAPGLVKAATAGSSANVVALPKSAPTDIRPPYQNATFVAADGEALWSDVALPFTVTGGRARNIARILTERSRSGQVIRYPAKLRAITLRVGDRVSVVSREYGYNLTKYWRVTDRQIGVSSPVLLTLQEDAEEIYDEADAATADPTPNTQLPNPWSVKAITGLAATSATGRVQATLRVTWDAVTDPYVADGGGRIEVLWRAGEGPWVQQNVPGDATEVYLTGPKHDDRVVVEVRAVNGLGKRGPSSFIGEAVDGRDAIRTSEVVSESMTSYATIAFSTTVTAAATIPRTYTTIATHTVFPDFDGQMNVSITGTGEYDTGAGGSGTAEFVAVIAVDSDVGTNVIDYYAKPGAGVAGSKFTLSGARRSFSVTAGNTYVITFKGFKFESGDSCGVNGVMDVEYVKR